MNIRRIKSKILLWNRKLADKSGMSLFVWKPEYSVGCTEIDEQHQQLFHIADELHRAMMERRGREALAGILKRLLAYTTYHFGNEERLMRETAYPLYLQHHLEHEKLTNVALEHQRKVLAGESALSIDVLQFLSNWLRIHIGASDQKLAAHLKTRTVQAAK
jgi:hemerythrin